MNKNIFEFNTEIYCYCDYMCIFDVLLKNILIFESIKNNTTEYKIISGDFFLYDPLNIIVEFGKWLSMDGDVNELLVIYSILVNSITIDFN